MSTNTSEELKIIEQKIEDARSSLMLLEKNYLLMQKLHSSEEYALEQLTTRKSELERTVKSLIDQRDGFHNEIISLTSEKQSLISDTTESRKLFVETNAQIDSAVAEHNIAKTDLAKKQDELNARQLDIEQRESRASESERQLEVKHNKIKAFTKDL